MTLDLSEYSTAAGAAKALHRFLQDEHDAGDNCNLYRPEENPRNNGAWAVSWEMGPHKWGVNLTLEESMYAGEIPRDSEPEVTGFYTQNDWLAEPHFGFDIQFFNE